MIGSIGFLFYAFYNIFILKSKIIISAIFLLFSLYLIYIIRIYLLLAFLPPAILWIIMENNFRIKNKIVQKITVPLFIIFAFIITSLLIINLTKGNQKYDLNNLA